MSPTFAVMLEEWSVLAVRPLEIRMDSMSVILVSKSVNLESSLFAYPGTVKATPSHEISVVPPFACIVILLGVHTATRVAAQNDFIFLWHGGTRVKEQRAGERVP